MMLCHGAIGSRISERIYCLRLRRYGGPNYNHTDRHSVSLTTAKNRLRKKFLISKDYAPHAGKKNPEILTSNSNYVLWERIAQVRKRTRKNVCHRVPQISVHMDQALRKYSANGPARRTSLSLQSDHHGEKKTVDLNLRSVFSYVWCHQIVYGLTAR